MKATAAFLLVLCHLAISHAWTCRNGPRLSNAWQIDAGQGQVVARDRHSRAFYLSGSSWYRLGTYSLMHVSVGQAGMWAVDSSQRIYKYVYGNWARMSGASLRQVDAGRPFPGGSNRRNYPYCLRTDSALRYRSGRSPGWTQINGRMKYMSCGLYGCWGVGMNSLPYFLRTTTCRNVGWRHVSGLSLNMIEAGADGNVFAVTRRGQIYQRTGISSRVPYGTRWEMIPVCQTMRSVSYDLNRIWAVTTSGTVMYCTH